MNGLKLRVMMSRIAVAMTLLISSASAWEVAPGPLMTRWSKDVSPERVWPEHPRPQMERDKWSNLNGLWQVAIRDRTAEPPDSWDGDILVPFPVESALSGVKKAVRPDERLWYRRVFTLPSLPEGDRALLHFGAVDWQCTVHVNGQQVGQHTGGFDPFTFDITESLRRGEENELIVAVTDPTDTGSQPRGKQVLKPHGIMYTAVTGIWQTVWLEVVPDSYIESLKITSDIDRGTVDVRVATSSPGKVRIRALWDGQPVSKATGQSGQPVKLEVPEPKLWSPSEPNLYDLEIELLDDAGQIIDEVTSYFGMRKIEVKKDEAGLNRLWLNNEVVFQYGPLDQGWWPDGLYTAPTDAALKYDIEMTKRLGMNMARKHVKVEPARWYYWCDKLGLLVWQDMPSGDVAKSDKTKANFRRELQAMVDALHHFPSIVMWVPFNEGWGQHDTSEVVQWLQRYDPTRPVNEASGWHDRGSGDVADMHNYPGPGMREPEPDRVSVLGEFGGLGMPIRGHTWQNEKNWGYVSYDSPEKLTDAYVELLEMMRPLIERGLAAAVYTQTTDVEIEVNGLMTYDRELVKMDERRIADAAKKLFLPPPEMRVLVEASEFSPHTWRYTTAQPDARWSEPEFDDSQWNTGHAGFGAGDLPRAVDVIRTPWTSGEIWIRRTFALPSPPEGGRLMLTIQHDEDADVYLNGSLVSSLKGHTRHYKPVLLDHDATALLRIGKNSIAIHCRQTTGGQFIDAGLAQIVESN